MPVAGTLQNAGVVSRYDLNSTREDLTDRIYNTDPVDTVFMNKVGREKSNNITKEWSVDSLTAASDIAIRDGARFAANTLSSATKLSNHHQTGRIDLEVSRRADIISKPGRRSETAYQVMKEMMTLKNSVELGALTRKAPVLGTDTSAGQAAGVPGWLRTNNSGLSSQPTLTTVGVPTVSNPGAVGTKRALTEAQILFMKQRIYSQRKDNANLIILPPRVKQSFSNYLFSNDSARIAAPRQDFGSKGTAMATVMGAVQYWQTDFGMIELMPSRNLPVETGSNQRADVLLLNPEFWAMSYLTGFTSKEIPEDADSRRKVLVVDWTVCSKNENASACIAAIDTEDDVAAG